MTKKQTSIYRLVISMALAMILVLSMAQAAFAADYSEGTEGDPAKAAVTKFLKMPIETTTPNATFTFEFEALKVDGAAATSTNMPRIEDKEVTFNGSEANVGSSEGIKEVYRETSDIVDGIIWPHAGIYVYKVTEKPNTWSTPAGADYTDMMYYSQASYDIEIYVDNTSDGKGTYVKYIAAILRFDDDGEEIDGESKVDPTPGEYKVDGDYSDMIFTNVYVKKTGGTDPADPDDTVLEISKAVTGFLADHSKYFSFSVMVASPEIGVASGATYKAYVVEEINGTDTVVPAGPNGTVAGTDAKGEFILFKAGTAQTINLKHGQKLAFLELPVGSSFVVTENAVSDYTASYKLVLNGNKPLEDGNAKDNTSLTITKKYIGEAANKAAFSNAFKSVTPTGISVDNLPYIVLIGGALVALIGYMVIRSGSRRDTAKNE